MRFRQAGRDSGQVTAFVVVMAAALVLMIGLVLDGGLTLSARERALGEAQEAARAGAQAVADADAYLAKVGATGTATATANLVTVTVTIVQPMQILSAAGLHAVTVRATATAVPVRGINGPLP